MNLLKIITLLYGLPALFVGSLLLATNGFSLMFDFWDASPELVIAVLLLGLPTLFIAISTPAVVFYDFITD